jgi:inner membrane transporter RhtA
MWAAVAAAGILALMHGGADGLNTVGVLLALLAGAMWAAYILVSHRLGRAFDTGSGLAIAMSVGALAALPLGVAEGGAHLVSPRSLALGAAVGILSSAIPYSLEGATNHGRIGVEIVAAFAHPSCRRLRAGIGVVLSIVAMQ